MLTLALQEGSAGLLKALAIVSEILSLSPSLRAGAQGCDLPYLPSYVLKKQKNDLAIESAFSEAFPHGSETRTWLLILASSPH